MPRSDDEIVSLYTDIKKRRNSLLMNCLNVKEAYGGFLLTQMPELDSADESAVANFVFAGIEGKASRISSTFPNMNWPVMRQGFEAEENRARDRKTVVQNWHDENGMPFILAQRARHILGYSESPVVVQPHFEGERSRWETRDPLTCFPPTMQPNDFHPDYCIFCVKHDIGWMRKHYPEQARRFQFQADTPDSLQVEIIEYRDADETVMVAFGQRDQPTWTSPEGQTIIVRLATLPNLAGTPTVAIASNINLDGPRGFFDGTIGMYRRRAQIDALEYIGLKRSIWPETWFTSPDPDAKIDIIDMADPMLGRPGKVRGAALQTIHMTPEVMGLSMMDRLERAERQESGVPAGLTGEGATNVRTARQGANVLSEAVDFQVKDAQDLLAASLRVENQIAVAIDKAYFNRKKTIYLASGRGKVDYVPSELFTTDKHEVKYSMSGTDASGLTIQLLQQKGAGVRSTRSVMRALPGIDDADAEHDEIVAEQLEMAELNMLQTMAQDPTMVPLVARAVDQFRKGTTSISETVLDIDQEMKKQQAGVEEAPPEAGMPGMAAPPGAATVQPPPESSANLTQMLAGLRAQRG